VRCQSIIRVATLRQALTLYKSCRLITSLSLGQGEEHVEQLGVAPSNSSARNAHGTIALAIAEVSFVTSPEDKRGVRSIRSTQPKPLL
jgi:hypothetical protein